MRWCRRNRAVSALLSALVVVFVAGFAGVTFEWRRAEGEATRASTEATRANEKAKSEGRARADESACASGPRRRLRRGTWIKASTWPGAGTSMTG